MLGSAAGPAELAFNFFTEQGGMTLGGMEFTIRKHGWLSGHWSLDMSGRARAEARKTNPFLRRFEISAQETQFVLQAQSSFTRSYNLLTGEAVAGTIRPEHLFTRRATVDCNDAVPELVQLFAFWLAALTWKRAANNNTSGS